MDERLRITKTATDTTPLSPQALEYFAVMGREHLIQNLNNLKGAATYANEILNNGCLAEWEAKEYSAVVYENMGKYEAEVARMNLVAKQFSQWEALARFSRIIKDPIVK